MFDLNKTIDRLIIFISLFISCDQYNNLISENMLTKANFDNNLNLINVSHKIVLATSSKCGRCQYIKGQLTSKNVQFGEIDLEQNRDVAGIILRKINTNQFNIPIVLVYSGSIYQRWIPVSPTVVDDIIKA